MWSSLFPARVTLVFLTIQVHAKVVMEGTVNHCSILCGFQQQGVVTGWRSAMFPVARCKSYRTYFELHHMYKAEANWPTANNCCSIVWKRLSTHCQSSYIGNCNICMKGMNSWREHHSTVEPPITDPPRSGQPLYSGQTMCYGLKLL